MLLLLVKWHESRLSGGFLSGVSSGSSTISGFQSCGFKSGIKIWQDLEQGLSMEVQDFALGMFMGATEEAAEHAKQEDMLTGLMGQQGV